MNHRLKDIIYLILWRSDIIKINNVYVGNNIEILKTFPDNSIDSVVTDPPYGLGKEPNAIEVLQSWITTGYHEVKGKGFMGKEWDAFVPQPNFWKEIYRVLKPGGYVLSFAGTRTYDWMVMAVRLAGFEIRDMIAWLYSSGFPKALDIEKQLKKMLINLVNSGIMDVGDNNENRNEWEISNEQKTEHNLRPLWEEYLQKTEFNEEEFRKILQSFMSEQGLQISRNSTCDVWREQPSMEGRSDDEEKQGELQGREIRSMPERIYRDVKERWIYNGTSFSDGETFESDIEKVGSGSPHRPQSKQQRDREFDALFIKWRTQKIRSITEKIKEISGWKTSLKPALEPIVMARKPLDGTVAQNVLKHGVGGINIDECRVGNETITYKNGPGGGKNEINRMMGGNEENDIKFRAEKWEQTGRFPANVIISYDENEYVLDDKISKENKKKVMEWLSENI
jgi:SAM-dependent methyltransferase